MLEDLLQLWVHRLVGLDHRVVEVVRDHVLVHGGYLRHLHRHLLHLHHGLDLALVSNALQGVSFDVAWQVRSLEWLNVLLNRDN